MTNDDETNYLKPTSPAVLLWSDGPQIFLASDIVEGRRFLVLTLDYGVFAAVPFDPPRKREMLLNPDGSLSCDKLLREYQGRHAMIVSWEAGSTIWIKGETRLLTEEELPDQDLIDNLI